MIGAELMARAVERQGVKTVFGLPGHLEAFFGALQERDIRLINMRHEAAVVTGADGYARTRRGLGVACVTAGPGLANALGGLATAWEACTPLLLLCGRNPFATMDSGIHQEMDHPAAVRDMTKWARTVHDPSRLAEYIDMACRIALSGRPGPVLLDVPRDLAEAEVNEERAQESLGPLIRAQAPAADGEAVVRAAQLLMEVEHPLIIAGGGAYWSGAGPALRKLANDFRLPVMAQGLARGLVPEDMEVGFSWPLAHPAAKEADLVLVAGSRLNMAIAYGGPPYYAKDARFIQID
ncbi:MAG: thiamine pyrophosphate-binding protein, partial [Rhodospirillales bacterium]|nr:thiamine pyrophosphate-binding protein [Rhodospirillales bacterium]